MALYIRRMQHDDMPPVVLAFPQDISVTPRGAYYAPYMGAPNNNDLLSSEAAIRTLTWTLNKASGEGVNRRVVLDQFRWGRGQGRVVMQCGAQLCTPPAGVCICMSACAAQRPSGPPAPQLLYVWGAAMPCHAASTMQDRSTQPARLQPLIHTFHHNPPLQVH
jgi:hypothetical protein